MEKIIEPRLLSHCVTIDYQYDSEGVEISRTSSKYKMKLFELKSSWKAETQFRSVAISPDGQLLVTGGLERPTVEVWNTDTGKIVNSWLASPPLPNPNISDPINAMVISSDGEFLVTGGGELKIWHLLKGKQKRKFRGFGGRALEVKISPSTKILVTEGGVGTTPAIFVWDISKGKKIITHKEITIAGCISSDSKLLLGFNTLEETIKIWNLTTGELTKAIDCKRNVIRPRTFTFSLDGKLLLGAGFDGIQIWDVETGEKYQEVDKFKNVKYSQHLNKVHSMEILSDNKTILSAGEDGNVQIWDIATGKNIGTFQGKNKINRIALSSNKNVLVEYSENYAKTGQSIDIWSTNED